MTTQYDLKSASAALQEAGVSPALVTHVCQIASATTSIDQHLISQLAKGEATPGTVADLLDHFADRIKTQVAAIRK